jgi:PAS domain S-box-containing protein
LALRKSAIIPPILLLVILAGLLGFLALNHLGATKRSRALVLHSHEVIETTQGLLSEVQDAETGQRGYLITQDPFYLDPYRAALREVSPSLERLRAMVARDPAQARQVGQLSRLIAGKFNELEKTIAMVHAGHTNEAREEVFTDRGNVAMQSIRATVSALVAEEERQLAFRTEAVERAEALGFTVALVAGVAAILGLGFAVIALAAANRRLEREIAQRHAAEEGRVETEALYEAIFANSPDYVFVLDVTDDDRFIVADANPALRAVLGPDQPVRGLDIADFAARNPGSGGLEHCREVAGAGQASMGRGLVQTAHGPRIWETTLAPLLDPRGRVHRLVGSSRDITEREEAEAQRRKSQRLEAVGQLTGGVAHDFNNLLQVIRGNLELLALKLKGDDGARQRIDAALHGADRAAQLTRQLLAFARRQPLEPKPINLGRLVGDMSELLRRTLGETIEIETVIAGGLWNTLADPAQVESAVLNLAINARDAMAEGGRLTLEATNAVLDEAYARRVEDVTPGQYVLLAVSDTGAGMSEEVLSRVFEPFFTTKAEEKGTGLGLAMVYGFVKQSSGHVQISSEPGQGTTVRIYLPRSRAKIAGTTDTPAPVAYGARERVLVVEDDPAVRAAVRAMLEELGYGCIEAADGQAALAVLEGDAQIDLLFTDVVMPGPLKSRDLVARAADLRPGLPALFTSGYTEDAIVHHGRLDEGVSLLSKPYSRDALSRKVRDVLRAARKVVLVVEDEALVRMSALDMVEALGFAALQAATGREALKLLKSETRIDILFTDVGLPDMKGPALAEQALKLRPELKVVFASGYASDAAPGAADVGYLAKPYDRDALEQALRG